MRATPHTQSTVLFLCSGNYYRSRFAEHVFNQYVRDADVPWVADSRGLIVDRLTSNIGPISHHAINGLNERGISIPGSPRFPAQLHEPELAAADLVIALKEAEHRPMLAERFPPWTDHIEYWHIDDIDCAVPADALVALTRNITQLIQRLAQADKHP